MLAGCEVVTKTGKEMSNCPVGVLNHSHLEKDLLKKKKRKEKNIGTDIHI